MKRPKPGRWLGHQANYPFLHVLKEEHTLPLQSRKGKKRRTDREAVLLWGARERAARMMMMMMMDPASRQQRLPSSTGAKRRTGFLFEVRFAMHQCR